MCTYNTVTISRLLADVYQFNWKIVNIFLTLKTQNEKHICTR